MRRNPRLAVALSLATAVAATALLAASPATAGPGWQLIGTYPSKGECLTAGQAGSWDEFRCQPSVGPLATNPGDGWDLWAVTWVG